MELNFKVFFFFAEKNKCKSREQCTGPTVFSKTQEHTFSVCSKCTLNVKIKCLFGFGVCIFQVRVFFFFLSPTPGALFMEHEQCIKANAQYFH